MENYCTQNLLVNFGEEHIGMQHRWQTTKSKEHEAHKEAPKQSKVAFHENKIKLTKTWEIDIKGIN